MPPLITIVTPLLNRAAMLREMLASLSKQGDAHFEHIVIDGGSTDGSQAIAAGASADVIEASGSSIYEALNIGIGRASGEILGFLNSDDLLADGALAAARDAFAADSQLDIARGGAIESGEAGPPQRIAPLTLADVLLGAPNINACFVRRGFFERLGPFDTRYAISADREWLARAMIAGARTAALDRIVYVYRRHAGSLTIGRNKPAMEKWVVEHIAFSRALLERGDLLASERATLRAFHAKETAHLAALALKRGAPMSAVGALADGFRGDALWPLSALAPLAQIAVRRARGIH